jgi:HlyD family secretion protein
MEQAGNAETAVERPRSDAVVGPAPALEAPKSGLPALVPVPSRRRRKRLWTGLALAVALAAAGAGGAYWWMHRLPPLPAGIAFGNGRIEADPIDIATKFAGRIAELRVDEGDVVHAGQALAVMDTRDLAQSLEKAEASVRLQEKAIGEAQANLVQVRTTVALAEQQMERTDSLLKSGFATRELFDQRRQQLEAARALENASVARLNQAQSGLEAASHDVGLLTVNIADNTLVAPRDGRIEYRIASKGEVLPAGGKVFTMLDVGYVYMDIYLSTLVAGRVMVGDEARIVLDAYPNDPIAAKVTFVSPQAQFTPKMVETQTERDKLMFRVRVRIDPERLRDRAAQARSGLPGVAYVRFDATANWPARLQGAP